MAVVHMSIPLECAYLADQLNKAVDGVEVVVTQGWPEDPTTFTDTDAIIIYSDGGTRHLSIPHLEQISGLMAQGIGLAMLHYAVEVPKGEPGDCFLDWIGGYFETHLSVNPYWTATFTGFPEHPTTRGVEPFSLEDEWYYHMRFRENMQGVTPVLSAIAPDSTLERPDGPHSGNPHVRASVANGEPQHLGWCVERPDGDVDSDLPADIFTGIGRMTTSVNSFSTLLHGQQRWRSLKKVFLRRHRPRRNWMHICSFNIILWCD